MPPEETTAAVAAAATNQQQQQQHDAKFVRLLAEKGKVDLALVNTVTGPKP